MNKKKYIPDVMNKKNVTMIMWIKYIFFTMKIIYILRFDSIKDTNMCLSSIQWNPKYIFYQIKKKIKKQWNNIF